MTVTETLAEFAATLDQKIEGALSCVGNPDAFLAANREIEEMMQQQWPAIAEILSASDLTASDRAVLESMSTALAAGSSGACKTCLDERFRGLYAGRADTALDPCPADSLGARERNIPYGR